MNFFKNIKDCYELAKYKGTLNALLPGYKCSKLSGKGGFASVFLMKTSSGKKVALRISDFDKEDIIDGKILSILKNKCSSKRIICMDKIFHGNGKTFTITEFVDGGELSRSVFKKHKNVIYKVIGQLIDAVEYIHSKGIIHYDIKPQNIMIDSKYNIKLIDFGGSSMKSHTGKVSARAITEWYAPGDYFKNWELMEFKKGEAFDWYTVLTTVHDILTEINPLPLDLENFRLKSKPELSTSQIKTRIKDLKKIVANHLEMKDKHTEAFINPEYKSSVRNALEKVNVNVIRHTI